MRLTPDMLAAAYDLLRTTEPFSRWNLPEPEDVKFAVLRTRAIQADYQLVAGQHVIRISESWHGRLSAVLGTVAHEMIHLHLEQCGAKDNSAHGRAFLALARKVCEIHRDFDIATF